MTSKLMQECFEQSFNMPWDSVDEFTQAVWETAWEASRANVSIKWPGMMPYTRWESTDNAWNNALIACEKAVDKALREVE